MGTKSNIEWCDSTFNPWIGCTKISPACNHCYAEALMDTRMGRVRWGAGNPRSRTSAANWRQPQRWNKQDFRQCNACGWRGVVDPSQDIDTPFGRTGYSCPNCAYHDIAPARRRVFCASLADVFDNEVPDEWRVDLLLLIANTPNLDWLLLTKRIGIAEAKLDDALAEMSHGLTRWRDAPWPNVWLGATVVNQAEADRDIPKLLAVPAAKRFVSIEPMLGYIDITEWLWNFQPCSNCPCPHPDRDRSGLDQCCKDPDIGDSELHWVICGGESGAHARPMHPDWVRSLRDQCQAAGVPFLFKQWGEWLPISEMTDAEACALYRPNRIAAPHEDQDNINECYGTRCVVETDGIGFLGARGHGAFTVADGKAGMQVFKVGKKAAGRQLDGREWSEFPA